MPAAIKDPTPAWMKAKNASVLDPTMLKVARALAHFVGLDDPQSQVLAMMAPMYTKGATAADLAAAIKNTAGASADDALNSIKLQMSRRQVPEQSGQRSVRGGVFWLPEEQSPWSRHYTGRAGYGGPQTKTALGEFINPVVAKASTGGRAPAIAFDAVRGKGAYEAMRDDVLRALPFGRGITADEVRALLVKHGGNPDLAPDIIRYSRTGNQLPYAIQENIVAATLKRAGHDGVLAYSKHQGAPRLAEIFDLTRSTYPAIVAAAAGAAGAGEQE